MFYGKQTRTTIPKILSVNSDVFQFSGPLIVHGLPVSCPFNFPNGNLKQQLSLIGVFICYQNIVQKKKLNLHIYGMHLLNPYKTVVSHLKLTVTNRRKPS